MRSVVRLVTAVIVVLSIASCASMGGMKDDPLSAGKLQTFDASFDDVVDAAREAVSGAKLQIEEAYQPEEGVWVILSKKGTSWWSWGELVRVAVMAPEEEDGSDGTMVRVLTKRKGSLNITAKGDYSENIFSGIRLALQDSDDDGTETTDRTGGM